MMWSDSFNAEPLRAKKIKPITPLDQGQPQVFTVDVSVFQAHLPQSLRYLVRSEFPQELNCHRNLPPAMASLPDLF